MRKQCQVKNTDLKCLQYLDSKSGRNHSINANIVYRLDGTRIILEC